MVQPLVKHNIIKKRRARFNRHQSDRKIAVKASWRRPKGIDNA
jgi:large subunit ribosomal protein L32e